MQTVEALGYIHHRNMVHRDIKPQNILLGPENRIWLSDFGFTTAAQPWNRQFQRDSVGTAIRAPGAILADSKRPRKGSSGVDTARTISDGTPALTGRRTLLPPAFSLTPGLVALNRGNVHIAGFTPLPCLLLQRK